MSCCSSQKILFKLDTVFYRGQQGSDKKGLGTAIPHDLEQGDDEFEAYRKRMMLAYRFRPNPLVSLHIVKIQKQGS